MEKEENFVYIDGTFHPRSEAKVSVFDHGFLYGDGVFEGVKAYDGMVFKLKEHIDRLYKSARYIRLTISMTKEEMIEAVLETLRRNHMRDGYVRIVASRGYGDLGLDPRKCERATVVIIAQPFPVLHGAEAREKGITAIISSVRRDSVSATTHEAKTMNYLNSILAKLEAIDAGVDEAIMLDPRGFVSETTATNIFLVKEQEIIIPSPSSGALCGITRGRVMKLAQELGYRITERDITPFELLSADEVFVTGTAAEVAPIVKIAGRSIGDGKVGPITKKITEEFLKLTTDPREGVPIDSPTPQFQARK